MKINHRKIFGKRLKEIRIKRGLTQEQLAKMSKTIRTKISVYECCSNKKTNSPLFETIIKLCKALDVSSDYLLGISNKIKR